MGSLQLYSSHNLASLSSNLKPKFAYSITKTRKTLKLSGKKHHRLGSCIGKIRAIGTVPEKQAQAAEPEEQEQEPQEPPCVDFAFVASVLLPDGTPDMRLRKGVGGQNLRHFMMESNIELYGPYSRILLNCSGGGSCGTCMVEVIEGMELLSRRTDKEKEKLKRKPKNWRLACQTTVGNPESRGLLVIQQMPEWKAHEWAIEKNPDYNDDDDES
uniref:Photosynthetic NDH subcomplex B 3 n=1 Tax=Erodium texanum TaxID=28960 RepID=A0A0F7CYR5_EROTE